jgi:hypothetical protein
VDLDPLGSDVLQISHGVILEVVGDRNPDGLLSTLQEVLVDEAGDGTAFADAGTVA